MKNYISKLLLFICSIILLAGCDSETKIPEMEKTVLPKITADPAQDQLINMLKNPLLFDAKVTVDMYFKDVAQEGTLVVAKNYDYTNVKTIQTITGFPSTLDVTGQMLTNLFGESIKLGDIFEIGLNSKYNNKNYNAFNPYGESYGADLWSFPNSSPVLTFEATYLLDLNDYVGTFHVVDVWWEDEYDVTIARSTTSETQLVVNGMLGGLDTQPMIIDVNMSTQVPQIKTQTVLWGDLTPYFGRAYTNMKYTASTGKFDMLNRIISFNVSVSVDQGGFSGTSGLTFTKK